MISVAPSAVVEAGPAAAAGRLLVVALETLRSRRTPFLSVKNSVPRLFTPIGFDLIFAHFGTCRSIASGENFLPQCGHSTRSCTVAVAKPLAVVVMCWLAAKLVAVLLGALPAPAANALLLNPLFVDEKLGVA